MLKIAIINGPNLNLLGTRETDIYGNQSFDVFFPALKARFGDVELSYYQSNIEGEIINQLHDCRGKADGIVLNAASYTHTSIGIADAIAAVGIPTIEVHISNVYAREDYRKTSFIASKCIGSITGLGLNGYELAIRHLQQRLSPKTS